MRATPLCIGRGVCVFSLIMIGFCAVAAVSSGCSSGGVWNPFKYWQMLQALQSSPYSALMPEAAEALREVKAELLDIAFSPPELKACST